jgi:uncharacterized protein YceH (UPF0502 family)
MPLDLSPVEVRVVSSLLEKEVTTPDTYPLTRNALVAACNQSTGRAPVLQLDHGEVEAAVRRLKERGMVRFVHPSHGGRSEKYRHILPEVLELGEPERAVLCLLSLRGPQTPGELKSRSDRLYTFSTLDEVQRALESLADRAEPLAARLPRRLGQKELRWAHLLSGEPQEVEESDRPVAPPPKDVRMAELEDRVAELEACVAEIKADLGLS